jgi:hypothetical protein
MVNKGERMCLADLILNGVQQDQHQSETWRMEVERSHNTTMRGPQYMVAVARMSKGTVP